MLAGRVVGIAQVVLREYEVFQIIGKLQHAISVSTHRAEDRNYVKNARELREWAASLLKESAHEISSPDIANFLRNSQYSSALPPHIAKVIQNGFPDDRNVAISSSELNIYLNLASTLWNELHSLINVAQKFGIEQIEIPPETVGLDIFLSRAVFDNKVDEYTQALSRFSRIASYLVEIDTGSNQRVDLTYTSTTDPVTGIAIAVGAATTFLTLYKLFLEVAEKQLNLLKTAREFRSASLEAPSNIEDQITQIVETNLKKAVETALSSAPHKVAPERINEISIGIVKDGRFVVQAIANGARIGITVESANQARFLASSPGAEDDQLDVKALMDQLKALERRVEQSSALYGEPAPLLLPTQSDQKKSETG